jgi:hypothetical protein
MFSANSSTVGNADQAGLQNRIKRIAGMPSQIAGEASSSKRLFDAEEVVEELVSRYLLNSPSGSGIFRF